MEVNCIATEGYLFSMKNVKKGNISKTNFNGIQIGKTYTVYGIVLYEEGIKYLIYDDYEMANWYPSELFDVTNRKLPLNWYYQFYGYRDFGVSAIWGYNELVVSEKHYNGLCEQRLDEVAIFLRRKEEMDEFTTEE